MSRSKEAGTGRAGAGRGDWREAMPCPVCGHRGYCRVSRAGGAALCKYVESERSLPNAQGDQWLHILDGGRTPLPPLPEAPPPAPRAPDADLDRAYRALFAVCPLSAAHRAYLTERCGLSAAALAAGHFGTLPLEGRSKRARRWIDAVGVDLARVTPGYRVERSGERTWATLAGSPGLMIGCQRADGALVAVKIRADHVAEDGPRYRFLSSARHGGAQAVFAAHVPPGFAGERSTVRLTEGEKKAIVATERTGVLTVSMPGADAWRAGLAELRVLAPARVLFAPDADFRRNPRVRAAVRGALAALHLEFGAANVGLETWPDEPAMKGIDDVLLAERAGEIRVAWGGTLPPDGDGRGDGAPPPSDPPPAGSSHGGDADAWGRALRRNRYQEPLASFGNLCVILRAAPEYAGRLSFNELTLATCLDGTAIDDARVGQVREAIERAHGIDPPVEKLTAALYTVAHERCFHPIRAYLDGLPKWDGAGRIARVATEVLGLPAGGEAAAFATKLLRKWLVSCVARTRIPGCKVDTAFVLVGGQGWKKSTFFAVLFGEFFVDCDMDIQNKDAVLQMRAGWCVEWGEIERVTGRKEADVVKAFVSRAVDPIRPPYGRTVQMFPRCSVIVGSTNKTDFLVDETGERRFWIVDVRETARPVDVATLGGWRDQLWAEAQAAFDAGETWWLDDDTDVRRHAEVTRAYRRVDTWEPAITTWLARVGPAWTDVDAVLRDALGLKPSDLQDWHAVRVGKVMSSLGWVRRQAPRAEDPRRPWRYYPPAPPPPGDPPDGGTSGPGDGTSGGTRDETTKTPGGTSGTSGTSASDAGLMDAERVGAPPAVAPAARGADQDPSLEVTGATGATGDRTGFPAGTSAADDPDVTGATGDGAGWGESAFWGDE